MSGSAESTPYNHSDTKADIHYGKFSLSALFENTLLTILVGLTKHSMLSDLSGNRSQMGYDTRSLPLPLIANTVQCVHI